MRVLVACEESQRVCIAFRERGHEAFSCDILPCSGGHPEWHIRGDALGVINGNCCFRTSDGDVHVQYGSWDLLIAHPPCTYLTNTGNRWLSEERYGEKAVERKRLRYEAAQFFMRFIYADCPHIAVENPIGYMSSYYEKPSQIIQPFWFGDHARKATCLWISGLPLLEPTEMVEPGEIISGGYSVGAHADGRDENGKWLKFNDPKLATLRSKTFPGIAKAMAEQWGAYLEKEMYK